LFRLTILTVGKLVQRIGLFFLLLAAGNIVLHSAHLDQSHLKNGGHDCSLCRILSSSKTTPTFSLTPTFIAFDLILPCKNAHYSNILSFLKDNRGPPLV